MRFLLIIFFSLTLIAITSFRISKSENFNSTFVTDQNTKEYKTDNVENAYTITTPKEWIINPYDSGRYIQASNNLKVSHKSETQDFIFSKNNELVDQLKGTKQSATKLYDTDDIIREMISPQLNKEGFRLIDQYKLITINNNSLYFYNSIYSYPDKIETIATEWTNDQGFKKLCIIEYKIQHTTYIKDETITSFSFIADISTVSEHHFDDFKKEYLKALESVRWNENYVQSLYEQNMAGSTIRRYQMRFIPEPENSYLNNIDYHNMYSHFNWKEDQICMGIRLPEKYTFDSSDYDLYNPNNSTDTSWQAYDDY